MAVPPPAASPDPVAGLALVAPRRTVVLTVVTVTMAISLAACSGAEADRAPSVPMPAPTEPLAVETPPPDYPLAFACAGVDGEVGLVLRIDVNGTPDEIRVEYSSRQPELDAAAIAAVRTWRFRPATSRGQPAPTKIRVPVKFTPPAIKPDRCFALEEAQRRAQ